MAWTDPITWIFEQVWSATLFNQQIRDNLNYLKKKPIHRIVVTADQAIAVTSWTKITSTDLQIILDITGDLVFSINVEMFHSISNGTVSFDIWDVDNGVYLSSGTGTPQLRGLGAYDVTGTANPNLANIQVVFEDIIAGTHNYEIFVKTSAITLTLNHDNALCYYAVWER